VLLKHRVDDTAMKSATMGPCAPSLKRERPTFADFETSEESSSDESPSTTASIKSFSSKMLVLRTIAATSNCNILSLNNEAIGLITNRKYAAAKEKLKSALQLAEQHRLPTKIPRRKRIDNVDYHIWTPESKASNLPSSSIQSPSNMPKTDLAVISFQKLLARLDESLESSTSITYKHRSEYDEGMDFFADPLKLDETSKEIDATIIFNLGRIYHQQAKYDKALSLYRRALSVFEDWHGYERKTLLPVLFSIAQIQYLRNEHSDAIKTYELAYDFARINFGVESLELAACLNCLGVVNYIMSNANSEMALVSLHTSLKLRLQVLGANHIDVGTNWNNIGRVHFQRGAYKEAMHAYNNALCIRRAVLGTSVDVAATVFNMGQAHHQLAERLEAMKMYQEFLTLAKSHFGQFHRDIAIVLTCIGQVYHEDRHYENAMVAFQDALRVGRNALGPLHSEIAITLNKVGNLHYEMGDLDSALHVYQQGLTVETTVLEAGNPNVIVTLTNIAEIHKQRFDFKTALKFYAEVLSLQKEFMSDSPQEIANTLSSIGFVHHQLTEYAQALEFNQDCLRIRRELNGDVDEGVAVTLTHIALVLLKMNIHDIALDVLIESYRIRKALQSNDNRDIAFTLYNIAMIYHHRGSHDDALVFYRETARVEATALGSAHRDLGITYYNIGQIHYQRGEMDLALGSFRMALSIERECLGVDDPTCARTLNEIGNIELQLGNVEELMTCFTEALRIYRKAGMDDNNLVIFGERLFRFEIVHPNTASAA
jgi:tetratricopeptide (TPR) repeat protein